MASVMESFTLFFTSFTTSAFCTGDTLQKGGSGEGNWFFLLSVKVCVKGEEEEEEEEEGGGGRRREWGKVYLQQMTDLQASDNSRNFSLMLSSSAKPRDCVLGERMRR